MKSFLSIAAVMCILTLLGCQPKSTTIDSKSIITKEVFQELLKNPKNREALSLLFKSSYDSDSVSTTEAEALIGNLYTNLKTDSNFFTKNVKTSYAFNLSAVIDVAIRSANLKDGISDLSKLQMRIYPVANKRDGTNFSLMVALENNGEVYNKDYQMFEYVSPCPNDCPPKRDILTKQRWETEFSKIGRKDYIEKYYPTKK